MGPWVFITQGQPSEETIAFAASGGERVSGLGDEPRISYVNRDGSQDLTHEDAAHVFYH